MTYKMYISGIKHDSIVDGEGFRNVIFISGCSWHCPQCHNPQTHNPTNGKLMTIDEIVLNVYADNNDITLSGGDPLDFQFIKTFELLKALKEKRPNVNIWCYTGYTWEQLRMTEKEKALQYIDVLVDGRYEKDKRDIGLQFKGSSNQRIIDVKTSLANDEIVLWKE